MKSIKILAATFALSLLATGTAAHAASVSGTVTDKTTSKPAGNDLVELLDVQSQMSAVAHATTNSQGRYTLSEPGAGPYLVRVTHQGAPYFIAAPQGPGPGDVAVFDVAQKVQGVFIEADIMEMETDASGQLSVSERWLVHNTSNPPTTQWSKKSFEIVLPDGATVQDTQAQRPSGLPTSLTLDPDGPKGHYSFNFPIQPDDADKDTQFQVTYTLPYNGKLEIKPQVSLPADNVAVIMPKAMSLSGSDFKSVSSDPSVLTFLAKNAKPGTALAFTVSGTGSLPREQQGGQADNGPQAAPQGAQPGGGIGVPINTPNPLSKYTWWILGGLALILIAAAAFLLRKPQGATQYAGAQAPAPAQQAAATFAQAPASKKAALLAVLKEEMFDLESERIAGTVSNTEYAEQKSALETVLKRALKKS